MLHLHPRNKGAHAIGAPPSDDGRERLDVPVVRVEDELAELALSPEKLGLIWIDVEGHEPQVLSGLGALAARAFPSPSNTRRSATARRRGATWYGCLPPITRPCTASAAHRTTAAGRRARDDAGHGRHAGVLTMPGAGTDKTKNWTERRGPDRRAGRAAARREHRRSRARDGEFRAVAATPGQAARRLAESAGAALGLRRRPHSRRRRRSTTRSRRRSPTARWCWRRPRAPTTRPSR